MDGTLVDNCAYHVKAWRKFSKKYGHELTEREILDWMGAQGGYYIEQIMGKPLPKEEVDRLCFEKEEIYRKIYKPKLPEGLREWLDYTSWRRAGGLPRLRGRLERYRRGEGRRNAMSCRYLHESL